MSQLITGASHAEAHRLKRILNFDDIILGDHIDFQIPGTVIYKLPSPKSLSFEHQFLAMCLDQAIYRVFPLYWEEINLLVNSRPLFNEYGIRLVIPEDLKHVPRFNQTNLNGSKIAVYENGILVAGELPGQGNTMTNRNGVYTWYEDSGHINYRLLAI